MKCPYFPKDCEMKKELEKYGTDNFVNMCYAFTMSICKREKHKDCEIYKLKISSSGK